MPQDLPNDGKKAVAVMNKKRFALLKQQLSQVYQEEEVACMLDIMCNVLAFDPTLRTYSPEQIKKMNERLQSISEATGATMYELKVKRTYEKNRSKYIEKARDYRNRIKTPGAQTAF
jgi:limonene-1,2-epoxide hydrolase